MGIDIESKAQYVDHSSIGDVIGGQTLTWMTAAEVLFLKAEAALRGWSGAGDAEANYETGIQLSFDQHGASGATGYVADNTSTFIDYVDTYNPANNIAASNP